MLGYTILAITVVAISIAIAIVSYSAGYVKGWNCGIDFWSAMQIELKNSLSETRCLETNDNDL